MPENNNITLNANENDINDQQAYSSGLTYNQWYNFVCGLLTGRGALRKKPSRGNTGKTPVVPPTIMPGPINPGDPVDIPTVQPILPSLPSSIETEFRGKVAISSFSNINASGQSPVVFFENNNSFVVHIVVWGFNNTDHPIVVNKARFRTVPYPIYYGGNYNDRRMVELNYLTPQASSYIDNTITMHVYNNGNPVTNCYNEFINDGPRNSLIDGLNIEFNPLTLAAGAQNIVLADFYLQVWDLPTEKTITVDGQEQPYSLVAYKDVGIVAANLKNYGGASSPYEVDSYLTGYDIGETEEYLGPIDWSAAFADNSTPGLHDTVNNYINYVIQILGGSPPPLPDDDYTISGPENTDSGLTPPDISSLSYINITTEITQNCSGMVTFKYGPNSMSQYVESGTHTITIRIPILYGDGIGYNLEYESECSESVINNTTIETSQSPLIPVVREVEKAFDDFGSLIDDIMFKLEQAGGPTNIDVDETGNLTDDVLIRLKTPLNPNWSQEEAASLTDEVLMLLKSTKIRKSFEDAATLTDDVMMFNKSSRIKQSVNETASLTDEVLINI